MDREAAKKQITETCGPGWLNLVDIVYDNKPGEVEITEVFQKWAGLKVRYEGEHEIFGELVNMVYYLSQYMCEVCGRSAAYRVVDGWETTLCDAHYSANAGIAKHETS